MKQVLSREIALVSRNKLLSNLAAPGIEPGPRGQEPMAAEHLPLSYDQQLLKGQFCFFFYSKCCNLHVARIHLNVESAAPTRVPEVRGQRVPLHYEK